MRALKPAQHEAEQRLFVRVRIRVPPEGLGPQLEIMHAWLDATCGAEGWRAAPAGIAGVINDAIAFYFANVAYARAFVARFCCGYKVETIEGGRAVDTDAPTARRNALDRPTA